MSDPLVTHSDMRGAGYCNRGAREWFSRQGLDWNKFRKEGLRASLLEQTGDAMALKICKVVRSGR